MQLETNVCALQHVSIDKPNEDSAGKTGMAEDGGASQMFWQEWGLCLFMVFIHWYLLLRQTWRHSGLPSGEAALLCLEYQCVWTRLNSWELSVTRGRGGLPHIRDLNPGSEVTVVRKPYLMMDDTGGEEVCTGKGQESNLMGRGFVCFSGEYVKGCLHSCTHPLPCLHKKPRHLASARGTSLEFWRQEVNRLILCKLQSWLWRAARENQPLSGLL